MFLIGATCLPMECCCSELILSESSTKHHLIIKSNLLSPWHGWKIAHLVLSSNNSLRDKHSTHSCPWAPSISVYIFRYRPRSEYAWTLSNLHLTLKVAPSYTTKVVSSSPIHVELYSIQHYVIKFVSDLRQVVVSSTNKTDCHDISEILLKVALNTINLNLKPT